MREEGFNFEVFSLSGSHGIGKTTIHNAISEILTHNDDLKRRIKLVGESAHHLLIQMNVRITWQEELATNIEAYRHFQDCLHSFYMASVVAFSDRPIIFDRFLIDCEAYRMLYLGEFRRDVNFPALYTIFLRSKRESKKYTKILKFLIDFYELPHMEVEIPEAKNEEEEGKIAHEVAVEILDLIPKLSIKFHFLEDKG